MKTVGKLPPGFDSSRVHGIGMEAIEHEIREQRAKPTTADVKAAFPGKFVEKEDGSFTVNLTTRREMQKWREIKRPWSRVAHDVLHEKNARMPRVALRNKR